MNFLEERIVKDGIVKPGNVLKVDSFLNHQMDVQLLNEMGKEFKRRFADKPITKILTIEASGIAIAYPVAMEFQVPLVFAKKAKSINIDGDVYVTWNMKLDATSNPDEYWTMSWDVAPTIAMQPNRVEQWIDGVKVTDRTHKKMWETIYRESGNILYKYLKEKAGKKDTWGFLDNPVVKNKRANAEDMGLIPGWGRSHMPQSN